MSDKRILLMYISEVSGHHQATLAIEKSLKAVQPDSTIKNINGFRYVYPIGEKIVNKAYMGVIKKTPRVWDYLYDNPKFAQRTQRLKNIIHKSNHAKLGRLFSEFQPDVVVSSQAFPCGLAADYKVAHGLSTRLIGVLTDYAPHRFWLHEGVDYYVVPSEETKERFIQHGIREEQVRVYGIPIDKKFSESIEREKIAKKLNLDAALPTLLIMGGGQGLGPIKEIVTSLNKLHVDFQLIIVAGTNKKLIKWLKKYHQKSCKKMIVYEYARNIEELMTVATIAITKPGGMTTAEALAKKLPMVIVNPLPGQEVYNTNFLLSQGAAVRINKLTDVGKEIERLITSPGCLQEMRDAAQQHSRPHAADEIAQLILQ